MKITDLQIVRAGAGRGVVFLPGLFLILLGVAAVLMPSVVVALIASFLVFLGVLFCVAAWKVMRWKRRFEQVARDLRSYHRGGIQGTLMFGASPVADPFSRLREAQFGEGQATEESREQIEIVDTDESGEKIKIILH